MAKKFYAVKKGLKVGIYESWAECQTYINGFSGAEYKSFLTYNDASNYLGTTDINSRTKDVKPNISKTDAVAYVDGSYDSITNRFSCGVVLFYNGEEIRFSKLFTDKNLAEMNNVTGVLKGAETTI